MLQMKKTEGSSPNIQVLERVFALFDVLAAHQDPVSLKDISEQTGLHPSTAHRILNDLTIGRLVDRPEPGSYREANYHDLVDMPLFIGRFDFDSVTVQGKVTRVASYPEGAFRGMAREASTILKSP